MKKKIIIIPMILSFVCVFYNEDAYSYNYHYFDEEVSGEQYHDPFEKVNRKIYDFNIVFYKGVATPLIIGYRKITTKWMRTAIGNFFDNLDAPVLLFNSMVRLDLKDALDVTSRFVLNTAFGLVGFIDVAEDMGIEEEKIDMGLTLGKYGIGAGPYLMIPFMGPTTFRDGAGYLIERAVDPLGYNVFEIGNDESLLEWWVRGVRAVSDGGIILERNKEIIDDVIETSFDSYATFRSGYFQSRNNKIRKLKGE